jgi:hypothetical protein
MFERSFPDDRSLWNLDPSKDHSPTTEVFGTSTHIDQISEPARVDRELATSKELEEEQIE